MVSWVAGLKKPDVKQLVRIRIDGGVQPVALVVDLNHRLVDGDVIRFGAADWL